MSFINKIYLNKHIGTYSKQIMVKLVRLVLGLKIHLTMDNSESGDELAGTFLTTETGYMVQTDDMDGKFYSYQTVVRLE